MLHWSRQGCKYRHAPAVVREFLRWLQGEYDRGVQGSESTDKERLDPYDGLPLTATLDALFDAGLKK